MGADETTDQSARAKALAAADPVLSVVVLSWNTADLTLACLGALAADAPEHPREVIVVDNGSEDDSVARIAAAYPEVQLIRNPENRLYAAGNNQGAAVARGEFLCTLNSDTETQPGTLDRLVNFLRESPEYGAVAPRLVHPDGAVQPACQRFPGYLSALCFDSWFGKFWPGRVVEDRYLMRDFDHLTSRDVDQPPGAVFVMAREEYAAMGGLDEELALFFNDVDLSKRLWARDRKVRYLADVEVMHHLGASTSKNANFLVSWHRNRRTYYRKHHRLFGGPWIRIVSWLRYAEEWLRIGKRAKDPQQRRAERDHLRAAAKQVWAR